MVGWLHAWLAASSPWTNDGMGRDGMGWDARLLKVRVVANNDDDYGDSDEDED